MTGRTSPSISHLRVLDAICRSGGIRFAAKELGVTHAAVSQAVSRVEDSLGRALFRRAHGRLTPTPAVLGLVEAYRHSAAILDRAVRDVRTGGHDLVLSLPASFAGQWLAHRLRGLTQCVGPLAIKVHADDAAPDFTGVDVAVLVAVAPPRVCESHPLFEERLTPLCSPGFLSERHVAEPKALNWLPLISHDWTLWSAWFGAAGVPAPERPPAYRLACPNAVLDVAEQGLGLALGSARTQADRIANGRLTAPFDISFGTGRRGFVVFNPAEQKSVATRGLVSWITEEFDDAARAREADFASAGALTAVA